MKRLLITVALLFILGLQAGWAQVPPTISYQGVLTDASGAVIPDASYALTFKLYEAVTGGSPLWTETQNIQVSNGLFNVILGSSNPLDIPFEKPYWLGVSVSGNAELTPRIQLTSSAYSLTTRSVAGGSNIFPSDGNVGIGILNPNAQLEIYSDIDDVVGLSITNPNTGAQSAEGVFFGNEYSNQVGPLAGIILNDDDSNRPDRMSIINNRPNGSMHFITKEKSQIVIDKNGNVGIGTNLSGEKLTVAGTIHSTSGGFRFPDGTLQTTATTGGGAGDGHSLDAADGSPVDALFVDNDGNVGIGTDNPNTELDVNGLITTDALFFNSHSPGNQINLEGVGIPRAASINWDLGTAGGLIQILGVETDNTPGSQDTELRFITAKDNQINTGMIINSTGYVGIGTRDPQVKLSLGTDINPKKLALWDGVNDFYGLGVQPGRITIYTQDTEKMTIKDNGNVGIGTINPQHRLDVNGDIGSGGTVYHSSDIRWKKNIQQVTNALNKVTNLRGVEFEWRRDEFKEKNFTNGRKLGFIAQEVEKIAPEVVSTDNDGYKSVAYANVTALLVEAIKTQQATIDALVERITNLERRQGITSR